MRGKDRAELRAQAHHLKATVHVGHHGVTDTLRLTGDGPYGCCAIALTARQRSVPQGWTGGDRVAIHGTNDPSSIGRAVSHGCLRTAEDDLRWLLARIPLGSHVEIVS